MTSFGWGVIVTVLVVVALATIAEARYRYDAAKIKNQKSEIKNGLVSRAGPYSTEVDLDVLREIESGGRPDAVSRAGARGPYQIRRAAWKDAVASLKARGIAAVEITGAGPDQRLSLDEIADYDRWSMDEAISRVIAWEYISYVLPRYLTAKRLDSTDETGPVPDSLDARLAAWNAGARAVRQAYGVSPANWQAYVPAETREFISRYHRAMAAWGGPAAKAGI